MDSCYPILFICLDWRGNAGLQTGDCYCNSFENEFSASTYYEYGYLGIQAGLELNDFKLVLYGSTLVPSRTCTTFLDRFF